MRGDAGTLGALTSDAGPAVVLHDAAGAFEAGWTGRRVRWNGGTGLVTAVSGSTRLLVTADVGSAPPMPSGGDPRTDWYALVDDPAGSSTGTRVQTSAPMRTRVATSLVPGWALVGVTATPQVRIETGPDLLASVGEDPARGETAALSVRVAGLRHAAQSTWERRSAWEDDDEHRRLLGPLSLPEPDTVLAETPSVDGPEPLSWLTLAGEFQDRPNRALLAVVHQPTDRPSAGDLGARRVTLAGQPREDLGRRAIHVRLFDVPDDLHLRVGPKVLELANGGPISGGRAHSEPALWFRSAPFAEAGYGSVFINTLPPRLVFASGVAMPDLGGGVDTSDTKTFGSLSATSFGTPATRFVVEHGELDLGRSRRLAWHGPEPGELPWHSENTLRWELTDIWFLRLIPTGAGAGELLLYTPAQPHGAADAEKAFEVKTQEASIRARIFKVDLGTRAMLARRRAAVEADGWPTKLKTEIQLAAVEGAFAVKMRDLGLFPEQYQIDQTTAGMWWMGAFGAIIGIEAAQFGSAAGLIDLRPSPWEPYWA